MGYRVDTSATLVLEAFDGAEVTVTIGVPLRALVEYDEAKGIEADWAVFVKWARPAWNLEDADGAIPADEHALDRISLPLARAVLNGWYEAAVQPPAPLPQPSSDTA